MTEQELEEQTREAFAAWRMDQSLSIECKFMTHRDWQEVDEDHRRQHLWHPNWNYRIRPVPPEPKFVLTREWFGLHPTWLRCSADMDPRLVIGFCLDGAVTHLSELSFSRLQNQKWQALRAGVDSKWIDLSTGKTDEMKKCGGFNEYPTGPLCRECERNLAEVQK